MTKSNRQGSDSSSLRGRSERPMRSRRITADQEKFLRKLLLVLSEIVDEKSQFDDEYHEPEAPGTRNIHDEGEVAPVAEVKLLTTDGKAPFEAPNIKRFTELCGELNQLIRQIQGSLNALGGGSTTAKALEMMRISLDESRFLFITRSTLKRFSGVTSCIYGFETFCDAVEEAIAAFKELGVFNSRFFNSLEVVKMTMKAVSRRLGSEYNSRDLEYPNDIKFCYVDEYLDSLFNELNGNLDALIPEFTKTVEKDIATVRLTQDFSSQRYLNLTTISTFLSSVTATTLQITANGPSSVLSTATNSLWFISSVFSTASALYSLLVMTWRQSAIRPPDLCLPDFARVWLRNGPMFALIAALETFSIGLCFLAFIVAGQRSSATPGALPIAFAGFHAYAICVLSAWFLFEQWKTRNTKAWEKVQDNWLWPAHASVWNAIWRIRRRSFYIRRMLLALCKQVNSDTRRILMSLRKLFGTSRQLPAAFTTDGSVDDDVERGMPGRYTSETSPPTSSIDNVESRRESAIEDLFSGSEPQQIGHLEDANHESLEAIESMPELAVPESSLTDDLSSQSDALNESGLVNRTLQFSADCVLLASALELRDFYRGDRGLLVRTTDSISVYEIHGSFYKEAISLGQVEAAAKSACWLRPEDVELTGFSCLIDKSFKIFDRTCKELESWDLSAASSMGSIQDATLLQGNQILCLERAWNDAGYETNLLFISRDDGSLLCRYEVEYDQLSLAVSHASLSICMYGEGIWKMRKDVSWSGCSGYFISTEKPVKALTFYGKADSLVVGYSEGEIFVWDRNEAPLSLEKMHSIRTTDSRALVENPVALAIGVNELPYLLAFGAADGTVKVWSVLSNVNPYQDEYMETFKVQDERKGWKRTDLPAKFIVLPPPDLDVTEEQASASSRER